MINLIVELTPDQYNRFKAGMKKLHEMEEDPTEEHLIAQLKREAAAVVYAAEVGTSPAGMWEF